MKLFCAVTVGVLVLAGACKVSGEEQGESKYGHMTQDAVEVDLVSGELRFNDDPVNIQRLEELLNQSYSVALGATSYSGEQAIVVASHLLSVLEMMERAGIDPKLVRLNLYLPAQMKRNQYHHIELGRDGLVVLDGTAVTVADLAAKKWQSSPFVIDPMSKTMQADYRQLLSVLRALGNSAELAGLSFVDSDRVEVGVQVYHVKSDGTRDVLSAPKVTTKPGNSATIKVVENASGRKSYAPGTDEFHQEDLANLGIRLSARPRIIGDYVRVSGVAILTKMVDRVGVFVEGDVPIASYSCTKTVVPFSVIFPPGKESVDFAVAKVDGKETMCRLSATVIDDRGMSRKQREQARAAAGGF